MKTRKWLNRAVIALLILGSGWMAANSDAVVQTVAQTLVGLRKDLTTLTASSKHDSVNYTNDVSAVILIRENLILPKAINYTNDVSGVILIRENLILPASINYANDVSGVILTAYRLADDVVRAGAINYSNDVSAVIVAAYGIADGLILAGAVNYSNDVSAVIVAAYGIADGLILAGAENYTNDATATVRTYAESLTGEVKPARFVKAVDDRGAIWKLSVHHNGAITATIVP